MALVATGDDSKEGTPDDQRLQTGIASLCKHWLSTLYLATKDLNDFRPLVPRLL